MNKYLINYFSQFIKLTEEEINFLEENSNVKKINKGDILLKEGQLAKNTFLVLKGCVKSFYLEDGVEYITQFYTENNLIIPTGYAQSSTSKYYLSCIEDSIISFGTFDGANNALKKFPRIAQLCLQINNNLISEQQISFDEYKLYSPEARYIKFIKDRPELVNSIPQYMVANYLGIQPQSLSRIRKRIVKKEL